MGIVYTSWFQELRPKSHCHSLMGGHIDNIKERHSATINASDAFQTETENMQPSIVVFLIS